MNIGDESVIEQMNQYKKDTYGTIPEGMVVRGEKILFKENKFFDDTMSVMLPEDFGDIQPEIMKLKYPSEQRPQIIKTSKDNEYTFTFSLLDVPLSEADVALTRDSFGGILKKMNPAIAIEEKMDEIVDGRSLGWLDYTSPSLDGTLYNVMYCTPINGKMLHGSFICAVKNKDAWKPVVLEVIRSIKQVVENE